MRSPKDIPYFGTRLSIFIIIITINFLVLSFILYFDFGGFFIHSDKIVLEFLFPFSLIFIGSSFFILFIFFPMKIQKKYFIFRTHVLTFILLLFCTGFIWNAMLMGTHQMLEHVPAWNSPSTEAYYVATYEMQTVAILITLIIEIGIIGLITSFVKILQREKKDIIAYAILIASCVFWNIIFSIVFEKIKFVG